MHQILLLPSSKKIVRHSSKSSSMTMTIICLSNPSTATQIVKAKFGTKAAVFYNVPLSRYVRM